MMISGGITKLKTRQEGSSLSKDPVKLGRNVEESSFLMAVSRQDVCYDGEQGSRGQKLTM